jgi:hypothetical protein
MCPLALLFQRTIPEQPTATWFSERRKNAVHEPYESHGSFAVITSERGDAAVVETLGRQTTNGMIHVAMTSEPSPPPADE